MAKPLVYIPILYARKAPPDHHQTRPDAHHWSLQMIIIIIWGALDGAVMRLILIRIGGSPPHVNLK